MLVSSSLLRVSWFVTMINDSGSILLNTLRRGYGYFSFCLLICSFSC